jgi:copper chaperone
VYNEILNNLLTTIQKNHVKTVRNLGRRFITMEKVTLTVKGMSCGHCVKAVEGSVGSLKGVHSVKVDLKAATVEVEFNDSEIALDKIKETIDDQGYDVK